MVFWNLNYFKINKKITIFALMEKSKILIKTLENISKLPDDKISEVNDFIEFLLSKIDEQVINEGIQTIVSKNKSYEFLNKEPDLYTLNDIKGKYK